VCYGDSRALDLSCNFITFVTFPSYLTEMNIAAPSQEGLLCSETLNPLEMMDAGTKLREEIKKSGLTRKQWYRRIYLKCDHWKNLKIKFFFSLGIKQCSRCKETKRIDVHHINYKSIYDVELSDLEALCRKCHKQEHKKRKERKSSKIKQTQ